MKGVYDAMPEKMKQSKNVKYVEVISQLITIMINS